MKDGKIQIGLIGAGNIAQNAHIPSYLKNDEAKLGWLIDVAESRAFADATVKRRIVSEIMEKKNALEETE